MTDADLDFADSLSAIAGWNQTRSDWQRLLALDPDGCFIAEWDGRPTGTATTTSYGKELAWVGMLLVHPEYRGRGIGNALLNRCLEKLRGVRCIKLDATSLGKKLYDKLGFRDEWSLTRWERIAPRDGPIERLTDAVASTPSKIKPLESARAAQVECLDKRAFGVSRAAMRERLIAASRAALMIDSAPGELSGYGILRQGSKAFYLGPVVATLPESGIALVKALAGCAGSNSIYWDVPDVNKTGVALAKELGFVPQRHLVRMYLGANECPGDPSQFYGIIDPAVG